MRKGQLLTLLVGIMVEASVHAAAPFTLPSEDRIQPSSSELERRVKPRCPGDCAVGLPFVASYRNRTERHGFGSVTHKNVVAKIDGFTGRRHKSGSHGWPVECGVRIAPTVDVRTRRNLVGEVCNFSDARRVGGIDTRL